MSNVLNHNHLFSFLNNSEFYRYMQIANNQTADTQNEQLLTLIAKNDLVHQLSNYLDNGLSVNYRFKQGNLLLHSMAQYNAIDCVRLLVKKGADINALSTYGSTPLENAYFGKSEEVIEYLVSLGAKADLTSLSELIEESDISLNDKEILQKAISYNDEMTDLIQNIMAFTDRCLVANMKQEELSSLYYQGMDMILNDHLNKLDNLATERKEMNYGIVNNALMKYDLTRQQAMIFRKFYLNQDLIDSLRNMITRLLKDKGTETLSYASQYLNKQLW